MNVLLLVELGRLVGLVMLVLEIVDLTLLSVRLELGELLGVVLACPPVLGLLIAGALLHSAHGLDLVPHRLVTFHLWK